MSGSLKCRNRKEKQFSQAEHVQESSRIKVRRNYLIHWVGFHIIDSFPVSVG